MCYNVTSCYIKSNWLIAQVYVRYYRMLCMLYKEYNITGSAVRGKSSTHHDITGSALRGTSSSQWGVMGPMWSGFTVTTLKCFIFQLSVLVHFFNTGICQSYVWHVLHFVHLWYGVRHIWSKFVPVITF